MNKEIAKIGKNAQEEIVVQLTEYRGYDLVDMRVWTKPVFGDTDKDKPTKKGLTVKVDALPELIAALTKAAKVYEESRAGITT